MIKRIRCILLALFFLLGGGWLLSQTVHAATTVTVNGAGDLPDIIPGDGFCDVLSVPGNQCTLRAAIQELNAQGPDVTPHRIEFNISGSGPFTISVGSELPDITVPVEIDGATQPGATCPTNSNPANLLIVLDGSSVGSVDGLALESGSAGSMIRGLVIGNFQGAGIYIRSTDNRVRCNHIGVAVDGLTSMPNLNGINILVDDNTIGGQAAHGRRNVISGNVFSGIAINGSGNIIRNNLIGTTADGLSALGNNYGITFQSNSYGNFIGGSEPLARNIIASQSLYGLYILGGDNVILGNLIGVGRDGVSPLPNDSGMILVDVNDNVIGGTGSGEANLVANNEFGIRVYGSSLNNEIRGNSVYGNNGLGIDLNGDGVDTNDMGDGDTGPNNYQNYPVLHGISNNNILTATLNSAPSTVYFIDIYRNDTCHLSGHGEGQELVYSNTYTTDASGQVDFSINTTSLNLSSGDYLTALATGPDGNTSEFSACLLVPSPPTTPTPTPTATNTPTPTATPSPTPTSTVSPTPTATTTPSATPPPQNLPEKSYIPIVLK